MKIYFRSALVALLILTGAGGAVAPVFAADLATSLEQSNRKAEPLKSASGEYKEALFLDTFERTELEGADAGSEGKFGRIQTPKWMVVSNGRKGPFIEEGKLWMDEGGRAFSKVGGKRLVSMNSISRLKSLLASPDSTSPALTPATCLSNDENSG